MADLWKKKAGYSLVPTKGEVATSLGHGYPDHLIWASLGVAVFAGAVGLYGGYQFNLTGYIASASYGKQTSVEVLGGILQTFFIPLSAMATCFFGYHSYKSNTFDLRLKLFLYITLLGASIALAAWDLVAMPTDGLLSCMVWLCIFDSAEQDGLVGALNNEALLYLAVCVVFAAMFLGLGVLTLQQIRRENDGSSDAQAQLLDAAPQQPQMAPAAAPRSGKMVRQVLAFGVFFPVIILLCLSLPDLWKYFTEYRIESYAAETIGDSYGEVWNWEVSDRLVLKLYPDILAFYLFLYTVVVAGWLSQVFPKVVGRFFAHRPKWARGVCVGEGVLVLLFAGLLAFQGTYWYYDHCFDRDCSKEAPEKLARTMGQLANCVAGLLTLPASRNNIFSETFNVSWEYTMKFHRWLGNLILAITVFHVLFWIQAEGLGVLSLPAPSYHSDDFTVPLASITTFFAFIFLGLGTREVVRRTKFEIFYYSHHFALVFFVMMLWHALSSWYYILGGLSLYLLDRALRFTRGLSRVSVEGVAVYGADITEIKYTVSGGGRGPWGKDGRVAHTMGQYMFVNVPAVAAGEWHPYTLSSAPSDGVSSHHIKAMGPGSFGARLAAWAAALPWDQPLPEVVVNVDGPYGTPLDYGRYEAVVLLAGGIGVTPAVSVFRELYLRAKAPGGARGGPRRVRLVWAARGAAEQARAFADTFRRVAEDSLDGTFGFEVFDTALKAGQKGYGAVGARSGDEEGGAAAGQKGKGKEGYAVPVRPGRPQLAEDVFGEGGLGQAACTPGSALVFACGPAALVDAADRMALEKGIDFHKETFLL
uniref:FAD-binding FR-type domain-containing protein n=1 Tax=Heterosigma akashiwo TaxID=2829 RepID=A0A7S3XXM9_HETAK